MESRRPKSHQVGTSRATIPCKKHPKHRQSPGVCSVCLREKLSKLPTISRRNTVSAVSSSSSSSSLSSLSSSNVSSYSSPVHRSHRVGLRTKGSLAFFKKYENVLTKSRSSSIAFVREAGEVKDNGKKNRSFWYNLLRLRSKRMNEGLMHSRTIR